MTVFVFFLNIYTYLKLEDTATYTSLQIITQHNTPFFSHLSISDTMNVRYNKKIFLSHQNFIITGVNYTSISETGIINKVDIPLILNIKTPLPLLSKIIWFSNLLTLNVGDEGYHRNASCTLN
jgi:hypothetical protein